MPSCLCAFVGIILFATTSYAQLLEDKTTQNLVLRAMNKAYNYEFVEAEALAKQIDQKKYASHPVMPLIKAVQMHWQYLPVRDNKAIIKPYLALLDDCLKKAQTLEKSTKTMPEAAFFSMAAHGYIALIHNYNGEKLKAVGEAKRAYNYVMKGFELMEKNPEFYMSSGLYNYYVEKYPEKYPFTKPLLFFFKDGDKELGLKQAELSIKRGIFTRTEGGYYLARIYLKHESNYETAAAFLKNLVEQFPNNPIFLMKYCEALILAGKYEIVPDFLEKLKAINNPKFLKIAVYTFEGLISERQKKNDAEAAAHYLDALKLPRDDEFTKEYHAFTYTGLARISARKGDRKTAKMYYSKAQDLTEYDWVLKEVKGFR